MNKDLSLAVLILICILVICSFCGLSLHLTASIKPVPREKTITEFDARNACQWFIKDVLVSPGSADFIPSEDVKQNNTEWVVQGQVDSQNKFGALIRSNYLCVLEYQKDTGNWILKDKLIMER